MTADGLDAVVTLPADLGELERVVAEVGAVLVLLDPLMSRLSTTLDTHKDAEVRVALEPLTAFAKRAGVAVLGIIHINKGAGTDPLTLIMGSRAFTAVARAVLVAVKDPEDDSRVLLGLEKSNLGKLDLPTFVYTITNVLVASTDEGDIYTGKVVWLEETTRSVSEAMATAGEGPDAASSTTEATDWLSDYLEAAGERMRFRHGQGGRPEGRPLEVRVARCPEAPQGEGGIARVPETDLLDAVRFQWCRGPWGDSSQQHNHPNWG